MIDAVRETCARGKLAGPTTRPTSRACQLVLPGMLRRDFDSSVSTGLLPLCQGLLGKLPRKTSFMCTDRHREQASNLARWSNRSLDSSILKRIVIEGRKCYRGEEGSTDDRGPCVKVWCWD